MIGLNELFRTSLEDEDADAAISLMEIVRQSPSITGDMIAEFLVEGQFWNPPEGPNRALVLEMWEKNKNVQQLFTVAIALAQHGYSDYDTSEFLEEDEVLIRAFESLPLSAQFGLAISALTDQHEDAPFWSLALQMLGKTKMDAESPHLPTLQLVMCCVQEQIFLEELLDVLKLLKKVAC